MHRILFSVGNFPIYSYGVCVALGVFLGYMLVLHRNKTLKVGKNEDISDFFLYMLLWGLLGARILYIILNFHEYSSNLISMLNFRAGGLSLYGALVVGICVFVYFSKKRNIDSFKLMDLFAPAILLGIAVGRIGCLMNGCCIGIPASAPWGMLFPDADLTTLRYPTPLYETLLDLIAMGIVFYIEKRKKFDGELMLAGLGLYGVVRFMTEIFRDSGPRFYGISLAQYFSVIVVIVFAVWIFKARTKGNINIFKTEKPNHVRKSKK